MANVKRERLLTYRDGPCDYEAIERDPVTGDYYWVGKADDIKIPLRVDLDFVRYFFNFVGREFHG